MSQSSPTRLPNRTIIAYNSMIRHMLALRLRFLEKDHKGPVSRSSVLAINRIVGQARRVFARETDLVYLRPMDPSVPQSSTDCAVALTQLLAACMTFEERYEASTRPPPIVWDDEEDEPEILPPARGHYPSPW
jgi:hypothetical protein